jgi:hypothetical protein
MKFQASQKGRPDRKESRMDEREIRELLAELLLDEEDRIGVRNVESFHDAGLMTNNEGLVVRMEDGGEFQLTIVRRN